MVGRSVVVVGYPGAELLDIACITTALDVANRAGAAYEVRTVAPGGRAISCQSGLTLQCQGALERIRGPLDTLIVSGGLGHEAAAADARLVGHVRRLARESRRVASVCTGATVLAAAGLLDGRRVTTHWHWAARLARRHPAVRVDPAPIFVRDGSVSTAAGVTSALDLTLAFVEEDHGGDLARLVARGLVTYLQRPGNQAQMSMFVAAPAPEHDLVRDLVDTIAKSPHGELGVAALAARARVSERHLTRLFLAELGQTPARYVRQARTEAAAALLVTTTLALDRVAARCGFRSAEALRQALRGRYGISPTRYRTVYTNMASASAPKPSGTSNQMQNSASDRGTTVPAVVDHVPDAVRDQRGRGQDEPGNRCDEQANGGDAPVGEHRRRLGGQGRARRPAEQPDRDEQGRGHPETDPRLDTEQPTRDRDEDSAGDRRPGQPRQPEGGRRQITQQGHDQDGRDGVPIDPGEQIPCRRGQTEGGRPAVEDAVTVCGGRAHGGDGAGPPSPRRASRAGRSEILGKRSDRAGPAVIRTWAAHGLIAVSARLRTIHGASPC